MKQPFVSATISDRRKGKELLSQTVQSHPSRPTAILSPDSPLHFGRIPAVVVKKPEISDLDKMKEEILKAMQSVEKKPRAVPKSKLIGMAMNAPEEPVKDYGDILAMLLAKK